MGGTQGADFLFAASRWQGEAQPLEATSELGWYAPDALPPDALPWLAGVVQAHLLRGEWVTEQLDAFEGVRSVR